MLPVRVPGLSNTVLNPGDYNGGATPVPIPNTEVKPVRADGTAWAAVWESRSLPGLLSNSNKG